MPQRASNVILTALAILFAVLCVRAGLWQWHKGQVRRQEWQRFAQGSEHVVQLGMRSTDQVPLFQRVRVTGLLDGAHQFLLENRSLRGLPGYEVLTPLSRPGARTLLVNRGWVPFTGSRARLPQVAVDVSGQVALTGRVADLPTAGLRLGRAAPAGKTWPLVASFPTPAQLSAALGRPVDPRILLLDRDAPYGYERDWQPPGVTPLRHISYAIQWWAFAALTLTVWTVMRWRRRGRRADA